jgi:hypothetical protein
MGKFTLSVELQHVISQTQLNQFICKLIRSWFSPFIDIATFVIASLLCQTKMTSREFRCSFEDTIILRHSASQS